MERPVPTSCYRTDGGYCCKVARVAAAYGLDDLDEGLVARRRDDASLRDLAAYVNDRVVAAALEDSDVDLRADPADVRHVITDTTATDVTVSERERIATDLDRSAVDTDALNRDFVSYETVRTHLGDHLDVDTSRESASATIDDTREMIASVRNRDASIVERALYALRRDDRIDSPPAEVTLTVTVTCSACDRTYSVDRFLDNAGCTCDAAADGGT